LVRAASRRKLAVHGPVIDLQCAVPWLEQSIDALLGCFVVPGWPEGFVPVSGVIRQYNPEEVTRSLSPGAKHLTRTEDCIDIYEEEERYWLVDDRWGMAEINLLRNQWRSWVLPQPRLDPMRVAEQAIHWPLSQLIRSRGVNLLPSAAVVRDGFAALILCPFGIEPELSAMISLGYRIISQRWTALREEDGRVALLHMPGWVERTIGPRLRSGAGHGPGWANLMEEHVGAWQNHAFCDAVIIAEPGRRPKALLREIAAADSLQALRAAWPIIELHPTRRQSQLAARLAQNCRVAELQLSRNPKDLLPLLNNLRYSSPGREEESLAA